MQKAENLILRQIDTVILLFGTLTRLFTGSLQYLSWSYLAERTRDLRTKLNTGSIRLGQKGKMKGSEL